MELLRRLRLFDDQDAQHGLSRRNDAAGRRSEHVARLHRGDAALCAGRMGPRRVGSAYRLGAPADAQPLCRLGIRPVARRNGA